MSLTVKASMSKFDRLSVFALLWGIANIFHIYSFPQKINLSSPLPILLVVAATALILMPRSVVIFLAMILISIIHTFSWMPFTPNHFVLEFFINIAIFLSISWRIVSYYKTHHAFPDLNNEGFREELFKTFSPIARISLFVLYFYGVFHKLNYDYFNPEVSCSGFLLDNMAKRIPIIPSNYFTKSVAVWSTLLVESAIPILFLFKRTRYSGIVLALGFHFFLTLCSHPGLYSFSCLLYALFFLFTPPSFPSTLAEVLKGLFKNNLLKVSVAFKSLWILVAAILLIFPIFNILNIAQMTIVGLLLWLAWGLFVIGLYFLIIWKNRDKEASFGETYKIRPAIFWLIPLSLILNGLNPYFGLKTQTSFSMFSNLRTEGHVSNHVVIRKALYLSDYQNDLVGIIKTNARRFEELAEKKQSLPYFEFCRIASEIKEDYFVTYSRNGVESLLEVRNGISNQPNVTQSPSFWMAKLLRFRAVDPGICTCKH